MAQKAQKKQDDTSKTADPANDSAAADGVMVDGNTEAMQALMAAGKERGYITHDELNKALPQGELTSEQIEDFMSELNSIGVNIVDNAEGDDAAEEEEMRKLPAISVMTPADQMTLFECICVKWEVLSF